MEVLAIFYVVLLPACIISFFICFFAFYRKKPVGKRIALSFISCPIIGILSLSIVVGICSIPNRIERYRFESKAQNEIEYLRSALEGRFNETEIREHYQKTHLNDYDLQEIRHFLYTATQSIERGQLFGVSISVKIKPETLPILAEVFQKRPDFVGFLAGYRDAPYSLKLKVSNSLEPSAVEYLARDINTPPEILAKLASHPSKKIAESASYRLKELNGKR